MSTIVIVFLLAAAALIVIFFIYDRYKKEKKHREPTNYIDALKALLDGREEAAFGLFREVVAEESDNIDAYVRIGEILQKYGKADKALQVHKDLTLRHGLSTDEKKRILKALTKDFLELKDFQSAQASLNELLSVDGNDRWATEKLLDVHCRNEDWNAAYEVREKLNKLDGDKSKSSLAIYKFLQGEKLFNQKEYHKARLVFKEAINVDKSCIPAHIFIGDSYLAENRLEDAVSNWRNMLNVAPSEADLVMGRLQKALFSLGKFGEISDICNSLLDISPKNLTARLTLAEYHNKKGEQQIAVEHLTSAIDEHPDSYLPILSLAKIYLAGDEKKKLGHLIDQLAATREKIEQAYQCRRCGRKSESKIWVCPSCKAVDSFKM